MKTPLIAIGAPERRRSRFTEAQAREILSACDDSGLPAAVFARQRGIGVHRLYAWRRRFRKQGTAPALIPVRVAPPPVAQASLESVVEVHRAGFVLRVVGSVDVEQLQGILQAMQGLPC